MGLLIAGVQKCGTTTLHSRLQEHPHLAAPCRKELHFFDDETIDWAQPDYAVYHRAFDGDATRLRFESTPIYVFWPPALERIKTYDPDMRIILVFRDPIERAWSHWRMETARGADNVPFHVAIRQGRWRLRGIAATDPAWRVYSYVERGFYARQLRRVLDLFPRRNVMMLTIEALASAPDGVLARIADFLHVPPFRTVADRREHVSPADGYVLRGEDVDYLRGIYADELAQFAELSGLDVSAWLSLNGANGHES